MEEAIEEIPGNAYEISQPIELRFNELISGVRSDVAFKIFGDDMSVMQAKANEVSKLLSQIDGASDVKVEQVSGLPTLRIDMDREKLARFGLDVADVQDVVSMAIGGRTVGQVFEGDQRFDIVLRLPESLRENLRMIEQLPIPLQGDDDAASKVDGHNPVYEARVVALKQLADISIVEGQNQVSRENAKRRIVVQANVRGRDMGSFVADASKLIEQQVEFPSGYWYRWGGQFENLERASNRLMIVVPGLPPANLRHPVFDLQFNA